MRICRLLLLLSVIFLLSPAAPAQTSSDSSLMPGVVPAFPIGRETMSIRQPARTFTPFDKVGRRFAILGYESGSFEAWAYPLKLIRNFEFSFILKNSTRPIKAADIARSVDISPAVTTITYVYQSFTVRASFVTPVNLPGAMILLSVDSDVPLKIVCGFLPVLQPMWPAGIGGQYAYWDDDMKAYIISEPTGENHGVVGSPAATGISYTPAHMLSDYPNEFTIHIANPASVKDSYVPIYIAGGKGKWDSVKAVYDSLRSDPQKYFEECVRHYHNVEDSTLQIQTPDKALDLAFDWAKVAYDNLVVDNPDLGEGLVAGLAMSGTSGRPGFGWFFGGDAFINSFSLNSIGAFSTVRDALAFTEKWQRADGKMAHELSQAAGYVDWFHKYPYAYIHADTTPLFIDAVYDYYRMTGDKLFVDESWKSLTKAYDWCVSTDVNGDGLMDNSKAGLGALEFGSLIGIESDVYLSAIWVRATHAMRELAKAVGNAEYQKKAGENFLKAEKAYEEKFWNPAGKYYSYAFNAKGERVNELTPWMSVGLAWNIGDSLHAGEALEQLASSRLTTDWGVRSISDRSKYYDPLNYNYGTVWPFITSWAATAEFEHRFGVQGYELLMTSVGHTFDNEPGDVTEVFSGSRNIWLGEAVAHQGFSTSGVVLPLVRGLFGLDGNAAAKSVTFSPQFPADWDAASASNYSVGDAKFSFAYAKSNDSVTIEVSGANAAGYSVTISPVFSPGTEVASASVDGKDVKYMTKTFAQGVEPVVTKSADSYPIKFKFTYRPTVEIIPPKIESRTGDADAGLKIISVAYSGRNLHIEVEGLSGMKYSLGISNPGLVRSVDGARLRNSALVFTTPSATGGGFTMHKINVEIK
jgi:Glycosyl-hydrolase family 116, catalytic region